MDHVPLGSGSPLLRAGSHKTHRHGIAVEALPLVADPYAAEGITMSDDSQLVTKRAVLLDLIRSFESCAVAFSAGVDSTVVAKAAHIALGDCAVAVTATSASLAAGELDQARELAELIGIRHQVISTGEFEDTRYTRNAADRCYHCKSELYTRMDHINQELGVRYVLNGSNVDDLGDYRPGLRAAAEHGVRSPLAETGITKSEVRQLAAEWGLPVWDKPATPCLSSRVAYGEQVTPDRLRQIDLAEQFLRSHGFSRVRLRYHSGDLARIEVPLADLPRIAEPEFRRQLTHRLRALGFQYVTLDLEGFRSGSLNSVLPIQALASKSAVRDAAERGSDRNAD